MKRSAGGKKQWNLKQLGAGFARIVVQVYYAPCRPSLRWTLFTQVSSYLTKERG